MHGKSKLRKEEREGGREERRERRELTVEGVRWLMAPVRSYPDWLNLATKMHPELLWHLSLLLGPGRRVGVHHSPVLNCDCDWLPQASATRMPM